MLHPEVIACLTQEHLADLRRDAEEARLVKAAKAARRERRLRVVRRPVTQPACAH